MPTYRASTTAVQTSYSAEITVNKPVGTLAGDLLLALVATEVGSTPTTPPTGWTLVRTTSQSNHGSSTFYKIAGSSEPASYTFTYGSSRGAGACVVAYSGADAVSPIVTSSGQVGSGNGTITAPSVAAEGGSVVVVAMSGGVDFNVAIAIPSGTTSRAVLQNGSARIGLRVADYAPSPGDTGAKTASVTPTSVFWTGQQVVISSANRPPNAPILTAPTDGATIDRNSAQRFDWDFSDPDAGDSQSAYNLRYRIVGAPSWTETGWLSTPNTYHDIAAGTLAAGDYEWQTATKDAQGVEGPFSASSFFTAATAPAAPTITAPINGATVGQSETVTWSAPDQDAYQFRRVADLAGAADTTTVYEDSGEVVSTAARSRPVTFAVNDRYEHLQVRIKDNGLWSTWASVRVLVSYTPPPVPTVTLTPDDATGTLTVGITNPAPGVGEPAVSYNDVYVDDGDGEERRATMLTPNTPWVYRLPVSGRDYDGSLRVVAVGDNGTTASS